MFGDRLEGTIYSRGLAEPQSCGWCSQPTNRLAYTEGGHIVVPLHYVCQARFIIAYNEWRSTGMISTKLLDAMKRLGSGRDVSDASSTQG